MLQVPGPTGGAVATLDSAYHEDPEISIDSGAFRLLNGQTTGTVFEIASGTVTLTGALNGIDVNLDDNVTHGSRIIRGAVFRTAPTDVADSATTATGAGAVDTLGAGALVVFSRATLSRVVDIMAQNVSGTIATIRYPSGVTVTPTGAIQGLVVDLSALASSGQPVNGFTVVGGTTTAAKASQQALVVFKSRASQFTTLGVVLRNKQASAGSCINVGWDSTNFEGAAASSILTGQTHVMTIDGQSNVDAATNNVEFVGLRLLVPATTHVNTDGIQINSLQTGTASAGLHVTMSPGTGAGVRGAHLQMDSNVSNAGSALICDWRSLAGTAAGNGIVNIVTNVSGSTTGQLTFLEIGSDTATLTAGAAVIGINVNLATQIAPNGQAFYGAFLDVPNTTRVETPGEAVLRIRSLATLERLIDWTIMKTQGSVCTLRYDSAQTIGGGLNGFYMDLDTGVTPGSHPIRALILNTPPTTAAIATCTATGAGALSSAGSAAFTIFSRATTAGVVDFVSQNTSGTIARVYFPGGVTTTLGGATTGFSLNMASNVVPGANAVIGADITIPASSSATSAGIQITSTQIGAASSGLVITMSPGSAVAVRGATITLGSNVRGYGLLIDHGGTVAGDGDTSVALRLTGADESVCIEMSDGDTVGKSAANEGRLRYNATTQTFQTSVNTGAWTNLATASVSLNDAYLVGGTITVTDAGGAVTLSSSRTSGNVLAITSGAVTAAGALIGLSVDMSAVSGGLTNAIMGVKIVIPATTRADTNDEGALVILSNATTQRVIDIDAANEAATRGIIGIRYGSGTTLAGQLIAYNADLRTNVTGNGKQVNVFVCNTPTGCNATSSGYYCEWNGLAGTTLGIFAGVVAGGTVLSGSLLGMKLDLSTGVTAGANAVVGASILLPASSSVSTYGLHIQTLQTAGQLLRLEFPGATTMSGTLYGQVIDCTSNLSPNGNRVVGLFVASGSTTNSATTDSSTAVFDWRGRAGHASGFGAVTLTTNATVTTTGAWTYLAIGAATTVTLGAALTGVVVDLGTNFSVGANAVKGVAVTIPASSSDNTVGVSVSSTQTGAGSGMSIAMTPGSGAAVRGLVITMGANATQGAIEITSAQTGGSPACLFVNMTATTATGGLNPYGLYVVRSATFTSSQTLANAYCAIRSQPVSSGGGITLTLSHVLLDILHAPTTASGGAITDTTKGISVTMTPASTAAVTGVLVTMSTNVNSGAYGVLIQSDLTDGTPLRVNVAQEGGSCVLIGHDGTTTTDGNMRYLYIGPFPAGGTLTLGAGLIGIDLDLDTSLTASTFFVGGINVEMPSSSNTGTYGINVASLQTGAGSAGVMVTMSPGASSSVIGIDVTMNTNADGDDAIGIDISGPQTSGGKNPSMLRLNGMKIYVDSGAPTVSAGVADGDMYFRKDGGALTSIYKRISETWTAIA